ncbi:MAG: 2-oxoacid:ferredoxin oxidoreductase subunit beta [candidate division Zixibacteria bacterium RBG_16_50_21]|nr:MAG: 2-oxoacid:ferredoxin oxidoreductase subunit beta [candidate division Zixibacteria bacterium RBG_16_50_21]
MTEEVLTQVHPLEPALRTERLPHIWCVGCGLGVALGAFASTILENKFDLDKLAVISGIGCTGRMAGYLKVDSFHTTHGRAIPFATGLHLAKPEMKVVVFSGDGDIFGIGGNHFIHAARRNLNITVICVNNFIYGMTGGQVAPTTPLGANTTTTALGNYEYSFNIPLLAAAAGATYVARWTVLDIIKLRKSIQEALNKKGFSLIEIISPCPTLYGRLNRMAAGVEMMKFLKEHSVFKKDAKLEDAAITDGNQIITGKFLDLEKPTYLEMYESSVGAKIKQMKYEKMLAEEESCQEC